jgi:hypothetical protein
MKTVKIKTLGLALALLFSVSVSAQEFHYGIKAGTNFAVQSDIASYFENETIRTGLSAGVFGNMTLNDNFILQTEVNYEQKGDRSDDLVSKYDYISVPVLLKYSLGQSDNTALKFNVNAGPYASYLVNAESEINDQTTDLTDNTEEFEFGLIGGIGFKYPVADNNLVLDLRLGLGLTAFDKVDTDPNNKYIGVTLGYEF